MKIKNVFVSSHVDFQITFLHQRNALFCIFENNAVKEFRPSIF